MSQPEPMPALLRQTLTALGLTPHGLSSGMYAPNHRWANVPNRMIVGLLSQRHGGRFVLLTAEAAALLSAEEEQDAQAALRCAERVLRASVSAGCHDVRVEAAPAVALEALRVVVGGLTLEMLGDLGEPRR